MRALAALLAVLALSACGPEELEPVTIVWVGCQEDRVMGSHPCYTVVEFPDGQRVRRVGEYGSLGDSFAAHRDRNQGWR